MKSLIKLIGTMTLLPLFGFISVSARAQTCPLGAKEDHLTIQRVMLNFGKFVGQADHVVVLGARYPNETVSDMAIDDAIIKLDLARACAEAVIAKPEGDLLPGRATFLEGDTLKEFIEDFTYFMEEFRTELLTYKEKFIVLKNQNPNERNWADLDSHRESINKLIDHAHRKTSGSSHLGTKFKLIMFANEASSGSLKANMKQIEKNLKAIASTIQDTSKNTENSTLAKQTADLFAITINQLPEMIDDLPQSQKAQAIEGYQQEIQRGLDLCIALQNAIDSNDKITAVQILKDLKDLKDEGHETYNP